MPRQKYNYSDFREYVLSRLEEGPVREQRLVASCIIRYGGSYPTFSRQLWKMQEEGLVSRLSVQDKRIDGYARHTVYIAKGALKW